MVDYSIWVVSPESYPYSRCFDDQAIPLQAAFRDLGYEAPIVKSADFERCNIVLGGHLLEHVPDVECIIWNLEQVAYDVPWMTERYIRLLRAKPVWDYSVNNVERLKEIGIDAALVPVGYHDCMRSIVKHDPAEWDVLFYGSMNERRAKVLAALQDKGLKVAHLFGVYGKERDEVIAKSKLVLNISYYDSKIMNITRCATLFANSVPVVSEIGPGSEAFHATGGFVGYEGLVDKCMEVIENPGEIGDKGYEIFSQMKMVDYLEAVLCAK